MSIDKTAKAILALPEKGKFVHREMIWQADWIDTDIATYAELKAMARLWLMRKEIIAQLYYEDGERMSLGEEIEALEKECTS